MDATSIKKICAAWSDIFRENCRYLVELDNVAGDGDIGLVLSDGFDKVRRDIEVSSQQDIGKLVFRCGKVLSAEAPSSMGTLLAIGFMRAGKALVGKTTFEGEDITLLMQELANGIAEAGGAQEGEKTILDSLLPGIRALRANQDRPLEQMLSTASAAAREGFDASKGMVAKHGRIAFRGDASAGIADPGAAVGMLLFQGIETGLT